MSQRRGDENRPASDEAGAEVSAHQFSLMDWEGRIVRAAPRAPEQPVQLARVERGLGAAILAWCRAHQREEFRMSELTEAIGSHHQAAPDSVRRVLAQLRTAGHVEVECVSRAGSLYRLGRTRE